MGWLAKPGVQVVMMLRRQAHDSNNFASEVGLATRVEAAEEVNLFMFDSFGAVSKTNCTHDQFSDGIPHRKNSAGSIDLSSQNLSGQLTLQDHLPRIQGKTMPYCDERPC